MTEPYDPEALFKKAQLFINRSFEAKVDGHFDAAALWATFALEILAKWALARINPCLIADPMDDGKSLLIAAGATKGSDDFKSIPAKAAYSRCARAFPEFDARQAGLMSGNRNEDVHSGGLPFAKLDQERWWQRFWREIAVLLNAHDYAVIDLAGEDHGDVAEAYVRANTETVALIAANKIARAQEGYARKVSAGEAERAPRFFSQGHYSTLVKCPACGNNGVLSGDAELSSEVHEDFDEEGVYPIRVTEVAAEYFECPYCDLMLFGHEYIEAAGLPATFEDESEAPAMWEEYNNE
jgi:hypothetical protein